MSDARTPGAVPALLLLTPREAADQLRVCAKTIERMLHRGDLRGVKIGRVWRLSPDELRRFIADQMAQPASPDTS